MFISRVTVVVALRLQKKSDDDWTLVGVTLICGDGSYPTVFSRTAYSETKLAEDVSRIYIHVHVSRLIIPLNYRPNPKDRGRYCFQFVSPHLDWGYPIWSTGGTPSFPIGGGGTPLLLMDGVSPSGWQGGYPPSGQWGEGYLNWPMGVPPPHQDYTGYSPIATGWGYPHCWDWME